LKSTTATPNTAASFGPYFDPEALLVDVDARSSFGGQVIPAVEVENLAADVEAVEEVVGFEDLQGLSF
jgi:hypothetical protein